METFEHLTINSDGNYRLKISYYIARSIGFRTFLLRIILLISFLYAFPLYASALSSTQTIVPQEPVYVGKVIVKNNDIYLLCNDERAVILMNKKGEILKRFGRKGEGPGEFLYLSDFTICKNRLIMGGGKRINIFSTSGQFLESINTKNTVYKVFSSDTDWFYVVKQSTRMNNNLINLEFSIYNSGNECIHTFPDETLQQAYHPKTGNKLPFPWFPTPFCNRPFFLDGGERKVAIFMARRKNFYYIADNQLEKKKLDIAFQEEKVTPKDLDSFFEKVSPKPDARTIKSVVYPDSKQFFIGAFRWDDGWALVTEKLFIIIDGDGHFRETISLPEPLVKNIRDNGYSDGMLFKAKELYCIKDNEEVLVFSHLYGKH